MLLLKMFFALAFTNLWAASSSDPFVHVRGTHFERAGKRYAFVGTNFWYGMNLGASDRNRLVRELDRLKALGVTNLRVLAASEGPDTEPWRIAPALQTAPGTYNEQLFDGFDFLIREMQNRDMLAVVCLNNFWPWSGGMSQYLNWMGAGSIPYPPPQANGSWSIYQTYTEKFYSNEGAINASFEFMKRVISRYANHPTIMAWELANEPRGARNAVAFNRWIERSSSFIRSLDKNHLITTGSEGETPWPGSNGMDFTANHRFKNVDYATIHIWAQNWYWFDPELGEQTYDEAASQMRSYLRSHLKKAKALGKPLVLEEFGLARDEGSFDPGSTTQIRDRYYREVFEEIYRSASANGPAAGVNFWAWGGEAVPNKPFGSYWKPGQPFIGDPPHEAQGWYSVFSSDQSTLKIIQEFSELMSKLTSASPQKQF